MEKKAKDLAGLVKKTVTVEPGESYEVDGLVFETVPAYKVPGGGFYTMDAGQAAELINAMQPRVAIPVHYGNLVGKPEDGKTFADMVKELIQVEVKIQF